jgi:surface carbohydrate biosynthesis protein (TIGR04326 family)
LKRLVVFDTVFSGLETSGESETETLVFPVTADWQIIHLVLGYLGKNRCDAVTLLPAAKMVDQEAGLRREEFIEWAAAIGNAPAGELPLRHFLKLPEEDLSAWWLGLLSDKDPAKNPVFLRIAQTGALLKAIEENGVGEVWLALEDRTFRARLLQILTGRGIDCRLVPMGVRAAGITGRIRRIAGICPVLVSLLKFVRRTLDVVLIKWSLPPLKERRTVFDAALLFFTYFPAVVPADSGKGSAFLNRYALPLQRLCAEHGKPLVWIATYAELDGYSLKDAVQLARSFIDNGDHLFFHQEFLSAQRIWQAFTAYLRTVALWSRARKSLDPDRVSRICGIDYARPFILDVLDESFYGQHAVNGLLQYEAFKGLFEYLRGFSHGLYYCEMMTWEYALNAANHQQGGSVPLIAYQHSAISQNYLHMFHSKTELAEKNTPGGIPFPEILAANGPAATRLLSRYYDDVTTLEAVRYLYLNDLLAQADRSGDEVKADAKVLLICTNIELKESLTLVRLAASTFAGGETGVELWLKAHPALPASQILDAADIGACRGLFKIKDGAVADSLSQSPAVLVGASTVAVEALAFGCQVFVYVSAETLNQSPLIGHEELYTKIYDPEGLKSAFQKCFSPEYQGDYDQQRQIAGNFWNLAPSLDSWKDVLGLR